MSSHDQQLSVATPGLLEEAEDDDDDTLSVLLVTDVSNGTLTLNSDGSFDYTPDAGFLGEDSFTIAFSDGVTQSDPVTVTLEVENSTPRASDDHYRTHHLSQLSVPVEDGILSNVQNQVVGSS